MQLLFFLDFEKLISNWLTSIGINQGEGNWIAIVILIIGLFLICVLARYFTKLLLRALVLKIILNRGFKWGKQLVESKVFAKVAHIVPAIIIANFVPIIFTRHPDIVKVVINANYIYIILLLLYTVIALFNAIGKILSQHQDYKFKPIESYVQLAKLITYIFVGIIVVSILIGKSPIYFIGAFGAMTAIVLLIFRDTILGLVASVQISVNDMIRMGDWITMHKYEADGDVIGINLATVKVKNFDKTVVNIPTYAFLSDSFINWRGMQETGARRIKRSVFIDVHSIKFCNKAILESAKKYKVLEPFLADIDISAYPDGNVGKENTLVLLNSEQQLTNLALYKAYLEAYLKQIPQINTELAFLVRYLDPNEFGLPLEVYAFSKDIKWAKYEEHQSKIVEHIYATMPFFDLKPYQAETTINTKTTTK